MNLKDVAGGVNPLGLISKFVLKKLEERGLTEELKTVIVVRRDGASYLTDNLDHAQQLILKHKNLLKGVHFKSANQEVYLNKKQLNKIGVAAYYAGLKK